MISTGVDAKLAARVRVFRCSSGQVSVIAAIPYTETVPSSCLVSLSSQQAHGKWPETKPPAIRLRQEHEGSSKGSGG